MKFSASISFCVLTTLLGMSQAAPNAAVERALPSGHPIIDNAFLTENGLATGYTVKSAIYPSGFAIPTEAMTALPSGYSVGPDGVYNPEGSTVSAFPSEAIAQVAAASPTTPNPGAPSASESAASTPNGALSNSRLSYVSVILGTTVAGMVLLV